LIGFPATYASLEPISKLPGSWYAGFAPNGLFLGQIDIGDQLMLRGLRLQVQVVEEEGEIAKLLTVPGSHSL
jgi:hypothetical protein